MSTNNLDYLFNPRAIAVAGVSSRSEQTPGHAFINGLLGSGYGGDIYPVNANGEKALGLKVYKNLKEIPGPIDLVISCIGAPLIPGLLKDCATKGVKALHLFTAGFSESGVSDGIMLEKEICRLAREGNVRILGPNCMGVHSPKIGVSFDAGICKESGNVGLICQSGGNTIYIIREAVNRGIRFSKAISYGNGPDINETDLLEYLSNDPETEIIIAYIEGVRDGKRFFDVLKETTKNKPVIVFKGAQTDAGTATAVSHTGAMSGSDKIWGGLLKQAGAVHVNSLDELIDMAVGFRFSPLPNGTEVAVIGFGGGAAVKAADECVEGGLSLPRLASHIQDEIRSHLPNDTGTIVSNPVDISGQIFFKGLHSVLDTLLEYEGADAILVYLPVGIAWVIPSEEERIGRFSKIVDIVVKAKKKSNKPLGIAFYSLITKGEKCAVMDIQRVCYQRGIPVYLSMSGAAKAINKMAWYARYKDSTSD